MQRIMVATDGSEGAERAIDFAAKLAKGLDSELLIATVGGNLSGEEMRQLASAANNIGDILEARSAHILAEAKDQAQRLGVTRLQLHTGWGDPAQSIIEIAARAAADVIVLGRRGRGRLAGLLLGSVSQKVASLAPCTVVVVP